MNNTEKNSKKTSFSLVIEVLKAFLLFGMFLMELGGLLMAFDTGKVIHFMITAPGIIIWGFWLVLKLNYIQKNYKQSK